MEEIKVVVLDDDPTGIQTVYDVDVLMKFELDDLVSMMKNPENLVYLSTNSRSFLPSETEDLHRKIIRNLNEASKRTGRKFIVISRGDSTLRGHYPLESNVICEELQAAGQRLRGEVFCPYLDGIRKTEDDIHYVLQGKEWIPCAETEFAKDITFGYSHSNLREYIGEKMGYPVECVSVGIHLLDGKHQQEILLLLNNASEGAKILVNATCMSHLESFVEAIEPVKELYQYRTAASFVKAFAKIKDRSYLNMKDLCINNSFGGLILAGSYVKKTTDQIECLKHSGLVTIFEYDVSQEGEPQLTLLARQVDEKLKEGSDVLVMTSRRRINFFENAFEQLMASRKISEQFVLLLQKLNVQPNFLISKGGITSYDVLKKGLNISSGRVLGEVEKNIPAVKISNNSLYDGLSVVVFPGNVGNTETLRELIIKTK